VGVWALDIFGNDDAADLGFELEDAASSDEIISILRTQFVKVVNGSEDGVFPGDYDAAIAAAALVIAVQDSSILPSSAEHYGPQPWPPQALEIPPELYEWARRAMDRTLDTADNDLYEVATEADIWPEQEALVEELRARLTDV